MCPGRQGSFAGKNDEMHFLHAGKLFLLLLIYPFTSESSKRSRDDLERTYGLQAIISGVDRLILLER